MEFETIHFLIFGGLFFGILLGVILQHSKFCMAAIVSNFILMRDYRQFHSYLAAIIVSVIGTQVLSSYEIIDLNKSSYLSNNFNWLSTIFGGFCFGVGSIFAGGCVGRSIVRFGEGNLGAIFVLITIGISGSVTMFGALEPFRVWLIEFNSIPLGDTNGTISSLLSTSNAVITFIIVLLSLVIIRFTGQTNRSPLLMIAGICIGLVVVSAWWFTGSFTQDDFSSVHSPSSIAYAGPISNAAFVLSTGNSLGDGAYFGIFLFIGTVVGSFINAIRTHSFHWVFPEVHHIQHLIVGGLLMGFGAILAGGCNIGQGITGFSTGSIQSVFALLAIVFGMRVGLILLLKVEEWNEYRADPEISVLKSIIYRIKGII